MSSQQQNQQQQNQIQNQNTKKEKDGEKYVLYFLPKGIDMTEEYHLRSLSSTSKGTHFIGLRDFARRRGAKVLTSVTIKDDDIDNNIDSPSSSAKSSKQQHPTHIVVSDLSQLDDEILACGMGFSQDDAGVEAFQRYLGKHNISLVYRKWIYQGNLYNKLPIKPPTQNERCLQITPIKPGDDDVGAGGGTTTPNKKRPHGATSTSQSQSQHVGGDNNNMNRMDVDNTDSISDNEEEEEEMMGTGTIDDGSGAATTSGAAAKRSKMANTTTTTTGNNLVLSNLFRQLSKLYQSSPLEDNDPWRAYTFHLVSGRLRRLPNIDPSRNYKKFLKDIKGLGNAGIDVIDDFYNNGQNIQRVSRLIDLQTNPNRIALRAMMGIWGVGKVRARELVNVEGIKTIEQARKALSDGRIKLDRNQLIGLEVYEDITDDEMDRNEVEMINNKVKEVANKFLPNCDLEIMGSYRRNMKSMYGDADVMITHRDYVDTVPHHLLGRIVDELRAQGDIAYHLTFLAGMDPDKFETLPASAAQQMTDPSHYGRAQAKKSRETKASTSYMGVFNSPTVSGKRRRVDIKLYPYRERIFASLYFTGNGHFNRSMRLWTTVKKKWALNDHGLFYDGTKDRVKEDSTGKEFQPKTERDVFDMIGIRWKEPNERDGFDAVEALDGEIWDHMIEQRDFAADSRMAWVN